MLRLADVLAVDVAATLGVVLADAGPAWPAWIALPANLACVSLLLWLVLTGKLYRVEDMDRAVAAERARGDERVKAAEDRYRVLHERVEAVVTDRDAWRDAHTAEVEARRLAEGASAKLLESTSVTVRLLDALERSLVSGRGEGIRS